MRNVARPVRADGGVGEGGRDGRHQGDDGNRGRCQGGRDLAHRRVLRGRAPGPRSHSYGSKGNVILAIGWWRFGSTPARSAPRLPARLDLELLGCGRGIRSGGVDGPDLKGVTTALQVLVGLA